MPECMAQDGMAAVFVGTFLQNGLSVAVCDEHLVYFCADTLSTMTGLDPVPLFTAISDDPGEEAPPEPPVEPPEPEPAEEEPVPVPTPPTPPSGRMRAVSSIRPTADASEQDATTAEAKKTSTAT